MKWINLVTCKYLKYSMVCYESFVFALTEVVIDELWFPVIQKKEHCLCKSVQFWTIVISDDENPETIICL